jgi:hypothetical protein
MCPIWITVEFDCAETVYMELCPLDLMTYLEENIGRLKILIPWDWLDLQRDLMPLRQGLSSALLPVESILMIPPLHESSRDSFHPGNSNAAPAPSIPVKETLFKALDRILWVLLTEARKSDRSWIQTAVDLAVLSDYNLLREKFRRDGQSQPELQASLCIAECKPAIKHKGKNLVNGAMVCLQAACCCSPCDPTQ